DFPTPSRERLDDFRRSRRLHVVARPLLDLSNERPQCRAVRTGFHQIVPKQAPGRQRRFVDRVVDRVLTVIGSFLSSRRIYRGHFDVAEDGPFSSTAAKSARFAVPAISGCTTTLQPDRTSQACMRISQSAASNSRSPPLRIRLISSPRSRSGIAAPEALLVCSGPRV